MLSDLETARTPRPIAEVAAELGLGDDDLEPYGRYKTKIRLEAIERLQDRPNGKYILVTAISPTPLGEGKSTMSVGRGLCAQPHRQEGDRRAAPCVAGAGLDKGGAGRLRPGRADGRSEPALHWR